MFPHNPHLWASTLAPMSLTSYPLKRSQPPHPHSPLWHHCLLHPMSIFRCVCYPTFRLLLISSPWSVFLGYSFEHKGFWCIDPFFTHLLISLPLLHHHYILSHPLSIARSSIPTSVMLWKWSTMLYWPITIGTRYHCPLEPMFVTSKWIFNHMFKADGYPDQCKAHWVLRGLIQHPSVDYDEIFTTMVKPVTTCPVLTLANSLG
jgi:hypothetical protein